MYNDEDYVLGGIHNPYIHMNNIPNMAAACDGSLCMQTNACSYSPCQSKVFLEKEKDRQQRLINQAHRAHHLGELPTSCYYWAVVEKPFDVEVGPVYSFDIYWFETAEALEYWIVNQGKNTNHRVFNVEPVKAETRVVFTTMK